MSKYGPAYRKSRIASRLIRKKSRGLQLSAREARLAVVLKSDPAVSNRLIHQALQAHEARQQAKRRSLAVPA